MTPDPADLPADKRVDELLALKIENLGLRIRVLQLEQEKLVEEARDLCGAPDGSIWNVDTRAFQPRECR